MLQISRSLFVGGPLGWRCLRRWRWNQAKKRAGTATPNGQHDARWHSEVRTTALVRDGETEDRDSPPDGPPPTRRNGCPSLAPPTERTFVERTKRSRLGTPNERVMLRWTTQLGVQATSDAFGESPLRSSSRQTGIPATMGCHTRNQVPERICDGDANQVLRDLRNGRLISSPRAGVRTAVTSTGGTPNPAVVHASSTTRSSCWSFKPKIQVPASGTFPVDSVIPKSTHWQTAHREVQEETGLTLHSMRFLGMWIDTYGNDEPPEVTLNVYFLGQAHHPSWHELATRQEKCGGSVRRHIPVDTLAFTHVEQAIRCWSEARRP